MFDAVKKQLQTLIVLKRACRPPRTQRTSQNPVTKTSVAFVRGRSRRVVGLELFGVTEHFHEAHLIRITDRRFTI